MFNLDFRDERYLPFEGAGAVSTWRLELPSLVRSFNYDTITDVILHMSYTGIDGDRTSAERQLAALVVNYAITVGMNRLISLKYDFPNEFHRLFAQAHQAADFEIEKQHFPYVLSDKTLIFSETKVYFKPKKGKTIVIPASLEINNIAVSASTSDDIERPGANGNIDKIKAGTVILTGNPIKVWTIDAGNNVLDKNNVEDILILIKYKI